MILEFFRCEACTRLDEYRRFIKREKCICGARRIRPVIATTLELIWFLILHPSYVVEAFRERA